MSDSPATFSPSRPSSRRLPFQVSFFYGWVVVAVAALTAYFSGPGQTYSVSVFIDAYIKDLGLDRTMVSGLYSVATLCAGMLLFFVGRLTDRFGARFTTVAIGALLGLACIWNSFIVGPITLFIGFMTLRLFGQGSLTLIPSTLVPQWFTRRRGRALSFMAIGGLASGASLPLLNNWLISTWNWHVAWRVWAGLLLLFFVPVTWIFVRNRPEDVGLLPDGDVDSTPSLEGGSQTPDSMDRPSVLSTGAALKPGHGAKHPADRAPEVSWTLAEAVHTRAFWFVLFAAFVPAMVSTGITFNLFSILGMDHIDRTASSAMLSFVPLIGFVCAFLSGFLLERIQARFIISAAFFVYLIQLATLWAAKSLALVILFVVLWGISQGFINIALKIVWPNYFGRKHLGSINSLNMMATVIGSAFGPVPFGWAYDHFGGYQQVLLVMMVFPLVAMVLAFLAKKPEKRVTML